MLPEAWVLHRLSTWLSRHVWRSVSSHLALVSFSPILNAGNPNRPATVGSRQPVSSGRFREYLILVQGPCVMGFCLDAWIAKDDIKKVSISVRYPRCFFNDCYFCMWFHRNVFSHWCLRYRIEYIYECIFAWG